MADAFGNFNGGLESPADEFKAANLSDGTDLTQGTCKGLYIEGAGAIKVNTRAGTTVTINVPANFYLLLRVARVWSTGTTATGIWAMY